MVRGIHAAQVDTARHGELVAIPEAWTPGTSGVLKAPAARLQIKDVSELEKLKGQFGGKIVIDCELPRVDDAHIHAGFDRVIEKHSVHRLPHRFVAAEGERKVRNAA